MIEVFKEQISEIAKISNCTLIDKKDSCVTYYGFAQDKSADKTKAVWAIYRVLKTDTVTSIMSSDSGSFEQIWDNRDNGTMFPVVTGNPMAVNEELILGENYSKMVPTTPSDTVEVYTYMQGTETVAVITVTYSDASKEGIPTIERT